MSAPAPVISILLVCRNPGPRLAAALDSVWAQQGIVPEIIVIDGASTDGTPAWLAREQSRIDVVVSEPDTGIYAAMNKAVARATGTWVLFLGSDDCLADATVLARAALQLATSAAGVVSGVAQFTDGRRYPPAGPARAIHRNFLHHQATFYRRRLFAEHDGFDATLRIMADYDLNLRLLQRGVVFETAPWVVAECGTGGASDAGYWLGYREEIAVRHRYFSAPACWLGDLGAIARFLRKRVRRWLTPR